VSAPKRLLLVLVAAGLITPHAARAQIDPVKRELLQLGYNQPFEGRAPLSAYGFFYYNQPEFLRTNLTLRLAVAPVYLDSELGIGQALGPNTDFGLGLAGGGFVDDYYEVDQGQYLPSESFTGHGTTISGNLYHLFNPSQLIPLNGVLRGEWHYSSYEANSDTAPGFTVPNDLNTYSVITGLRLGGMEPLLIPEVAMEISAWYHGEYRANPGAYGFNGDRSVLPQSHLFWGRALLAYTLPESRHNFLVSLTGGSSVDADRLSAYRLGGYLPLAAEFPLILPGYYYQEISASRFALLNVNYNFPLDAKKRWAVNFIGSTAAVRYLPGLEQANEWNSGVGGGIGYRSSSGAWQVLLDYGYGFNAIRSHGLGAQSIGLLVQFNFVQVKDEDNNTGPYNNIMLRSLDRFLHTFD
jgi:hypothetical protein